jgi:tellurite resistance protein TehA-like permease
MTPVWLLPVVTLIVASSTGGIIAHALQRYSLSHAVITATCSVFLVTIGLSLALMMLTVYLLRLIVHGLPPGGTIISTFLPLGPTGQAGFAILLHGEFFQSILPLDHGKSALLRSASSPDVIYVICVTIAFVLWSLATMWAIFAFLGVQSVFRQGQIPFKVAIWGLVFPNVHLSLPGDAASH